MKKRVERIQASSSGWGGVGGPGSKLGGPGAPCWDGTWEQGLEEMRVFCFFFSPLDLSGTVHPSKENDQGQARASGASGWKGKQGIYRTIRRLIRKWGKVMESHVSHIR